MTLGCERPISRGPMPSPSGASAVGPCVTLGRPKTDTSEVSCAFADLDAGEVTADLKGVEEAGGMRFILGGEPNWKDWGEDRAPARSILADESERLFRAAQ